MGFVGLILEEQHLAKGRCSEKCYLAMLLAQDGAEDGRKY
jgi:hypothetical protein